MSDLAKSNSLPNSFNGQSTMNHPSEPLHSSGQSNRSFNDTFHHFDISAIDYSDLSVCPRVPFFEGGDRRAVLDEVAHLCQFSHNLVGVIGGAGVGKTALAYQTATELSEAADCCVMVSSLMNTTENMLLLLTQQLGIFIAENADLEQMIATINQYQPSGAHQSVVIIVDEAHHLDETALYAFVQLLQKPAPNYFHVLLIGDSELQIRLDRLDKENVLVYDIPLRAFNESEIEQYVSFKLSQIGYQGAELFDADAVEHIWRETEGFPQKINHVANKMLLAVDSIDGEGQRLGLPISYMVVVVILLAALILAVFYIDDESSVTSDAAVLEEVTILEGPKGSGQTKVSTRVPLDSDTSEGQAEANEQGGVNVDESEVDSIKDIENDIEGGIESDLERGEESSFLILDSRSLSTSADNTDSTSNSDANDGVAENDSQGGTLSEPSKVKKIVDEKTISASQSPVTVKGNIAPPVLPIEVATVKPVAANAKTSGEAAVMSWPENNYTLQVMAAGQLVSVKQFINNQSNRDLLRVISLRRNGAPWYVVFTGVYSTREEAVLAISFLPDVQKNTRPWPRKISEIKQEITIFRRK